jgi:hypothetical protein
MIIELADISLGLRLYEGGQGAVYELDPAFARSLGWQGRVLAKLYRRFQPEPALEAFSDRVRWSAALAPELRCELHAATAWPIAAIAERNHLAGIVMPDERARYGARMTLPSGRTDTVLMSLEHALANDAYLAKCFGLVCDTRIRVAIAEQLSSAVAVLHRHAIVASDISHKNVLVKVAAPTSVTLIDSDSMTFQGESTLTPVETPGWELPEEWSEPPTTRGADAYKLGLAIMRLFARQQFALDLNDVEPLVPAALRQHLRAALACSPSERPAAGLWTAALRDVLVSLADQPMSSSTETSTVRPTPASQTSTSAGHRTRTPSPVVTGVTQTGTQRPSALNAISSPLKPGLAQRGGGSATLVRRHQTALVLLAAAALIVILATVKSQHPNQSSASTAQQATPAQTTATHHATHPHRTKVHHSPRASDGKVRVLTTPHVTPPVPVRTAPVTSTPTPVSRPPHSTPPPATSDKPVGGSLNGTAEETASGTAENGRLEGKAEPAPAGNEGGSLSGSAK